MIQIKKVVIDLKFKVYYSHSHSLVHNITEIQEELFSHK
ncbi:MAG: hypothetical protein HW406_681 [Candidatus Brocadiaceae bacterium]|nr:hypothetical protein [Candidatus Brocadiaceae bacterium]